MSLLVATVGASTANSYGTRQESITYFQLTAHPEAETWARLEIHLKDAYLIQATQDIELQRLSGSKATTSKTTGVPDQALHYPRSQDSDSGTAFVPQDIKYAQFEQALHIYQQGGIASARRQAQAEGVEEIQIGSTRERYGKTDNSPASLLSVKVKARLIKGGYVVSKGPVKV